MKIPRFRMPNFGRKPVPKQEPRYAARPLQFIANETGTRTLVLCLNWRTIMLSTGADAAIASAREGGATHYCAIGSKAVGYGFVPKNELAQVPQASYPAALLAARQYKGDSLVAFRLSATEVWVAQIHNGEPRGVDEVLSARGGQPLEVLATQWLTERLSKSGDLSVYTDIDVGSIDATPASLQSLMGASVIPSDTLVPVPAASLFEHLPKPALKALGLACLAYLANTAYETWSDQQQAARRAQDLATLRENENPEKVWREALGRAGTTRISPSADSLIPLRKSIGKLPINLRGWSLKTASCKPQAAQGGKLAWACAASYESAGKLQTATNLELQQSAIPQGFTAKFEPLQALTLEWGVAVGVSPLNIAELHSKDHHLLVTASKLQELIPALTDAPKIAFTSISVSPPRKADGTAIALPQGVTIPQEAVISIKGPLRTLDALIERGFAADWKSLDLSVGQVAGDAVNLRNSALSINLTGVIYAK